MKETGRSYLPENGDVVWSDRLLAHFNEEYEELLPRAGDGHNQVIIKNLAELKFKMEESIRQCRALNLSPKETEASIMNAIEKYENGRDGLMRELI